jgi:hypothetical protein
MIRLALVTLAAVTLVSAGVASASNGKTRVQVDRFADEYSFAADCGGFQNVVSGKEHVDVTEIYAAGDGTLLQTVFQVGFAETDTNSVTGKSHRLHGVAHEVWDYASNTRTLTGAVFTGTEPGSGTYVQDTGRISMTLDTYEAFFVAGPHEAFFAGGIDAVACAALAS